MAKYGTWLGAGIGFVVGGPLGLLLGMFVGSLFDTPTVPVAESGPVGGRRPTGRGDFMFSLTVLATAVMKADGTITRNELNYVKVFLKNNFGEQATGEALQMIKRLSGQPFDVVAVCRQIRLNMEHPARIQLLYFLFGIAQADGRVCEKELYLLDTIARELGIDSATYASLKAMYHDDLDSAYRTLGVDKTVSDAELKKAYRKIAVENHPDKVGHLGEDIRKAAEKKFSAINVAYEKIKKQRGLN